METIVAIKTIESVIDTLKDLKAEINKDDFSNSLVSFDKYKQIKRELEDCKDELDEEREYNEQLRDKINELENDPSIKFDFAIHRDDWQFFRQNEMSLTGHRISNGQIKELVDVHIKPDNLPETFKHCHIYFYTPDELISFIDYVRQHNIQLFSLRKFRYSSINQ